MQIEIIEDNLDTFTKNSKSSESPDNNNKNMNFTDEELIQEINRNQDDTFASLGTNPYSFLSTGNSTNRIFNIIQSLICL